jgi:glycosyltransferase involved in cell wall biosynthesis/threonine dehydrogenase-like Zn-dependent dehydrogenase
MPETSIIIRSFNEAEYIGDVLAAVQEQKYTDFEIILVDSGSTDGTLEIAEEYVDKTEFVAPQNFTFGYSCNVGCEAASGDYCSFLSAHAIPSDNQWLGTLVEHLSEDEVAMAYSNQVGAETTKFSERRLFDELFPAERRRQQPPDYWANNASSAFKRSLWEEHQFNEFLTGHEDIEWAKHFMDQGYVVVYEPDSCIYHIHDETWEQVFNRFEREAIADVEIGIKSPSDRWHEYLNVPKDIIGDLIAAVKRDELSRESLTEIVKFRYNQHMGTASGLLSEPDLESNRYDYYYDNANESVYFRSDGSTSVEQHPLPDLKPGEVFVNTTYAGVEPEPNRPSGSEAYPIVPQGSYVGTIIEAGPNVDSVDVGDTVVGEIRFRCGVCPGCNGGHERRCEDPTVLGIDTEYGAHSRYISVPSEHVTALTDSVDPRDAILTRPVAAITELLSRAEPLLDEHPNCLVIGDTARAELAVQLFTLRDSTPSVSRKSGTTPTESIDFSEFDIVMEATGSPELARESIEKTDRGAVIVLLGKQYDEYSLTNRDVYGKTVLKADLGAARPTSETLELLRDVQTEEVIGGEFGMHEYTAAKTRAESEQTYQIIDIGAGSISSD